MRYISELIDKNRKTKLSESSVMFPDKKRIKKDSKVNLLALGDVGGTVLMGLKLLGGRTISQIGIYDLWMKKWRDDMRWRSIRYLFPMEENCLL